MASQISLARAIAYLTRPLIVAYPATTIIALQFHLDANLAPLFVDRSAPRCFSLSPSCLPPRPIYAACLATGIQWFDWIALLGNREFDLFINQNSVSVRFGPAAQLISIWSSSPTTTHDTSTVESSETRIQAHILAQTAARARARKTLAQQILEADTESDDQLFALIADEVRAPTWKTPTTPHFPTFAPLNVPARRPDSPESTHSRSSSRSSGSISNFSFTSSDSFGSRTSLASSASSSKCAEDGLKPSRRERARVFVDTTKTEVTPYDGGKTTVLTGGVMLGAPPKAKKITSTPRPAITRGVAPSWRLCA